MGYDESPSRLKPIFIGAVVGVVFGVLTGLRLAGGDIVVPIPICAGGGALVGVLAGLAVMVKQMAGGGFLGTLAMTFIIMILVIVVGVGLTLMMA